jgi:hypothetical protein
MDKNYVPTETPDFQIKVWVGKEFRELTPAEEHQIQTRRKILKTGGNGEYILVDHPDRIELGNGRFKKVRNKRTNYTPPKKKRKK